MVFNNLLPAGADETEDCPIDRLSVLLRKSIESESAPHNPLTVNIIAAEQRSASIVLLKSGTDWNEPESVVWRWSASESPEIAKEHVAWFDNPSECKPVYGLSHLLTVASGGGVALIRLADHKVLFYAMSGGNTHSAAMLPDGNIVTASSTGNYLTLFVVPEVFAGPDKVKSVKITFEDAHGLAWDRFHKVLWALGGNRLAGYQYNEDRSNPSLKEIFALSLPDELKGGHDLYTITGTKYLFVTGNGGTGIFDPDTRKISVLSNTPRIKSISLLSDGTLLVLQPREQWWAESLFFLNKPFTPAGTMNKARFYKGRWWIPDELGF